MTKEKFLKRIWDEHLNDFSIEISLKKEIIKIPNVFGISLLNGLYTVYKTDNKSNVSILEKYYDENEAFHELYRNVLSEKYLQNT